ncbi:prenylated rab acceptor PRA1 [Ascodesmis nigricans]|uniref:PRA1 family protein n=1 Tax=Ascodesmis nigricans TaxID=341454 RepID=A0A4V3SI17_9PEZI|nr:prenylated rab acceptor PRA1 [Ascodesmis nigricans]
MPQINLPIGLLSERFNLNRFTNGQQMPLANRFSNLRPLGEFFDFKRMSKPQNFGEVQSRVAYNVSYFSSNYAVVFALLSIYSLLTNTLLLFVIVLVVGGMWGIGRLGGADLEIGPVKATSSQLYTTLFGTAVVLGIFASPFATILWLIGASSVTILGHASFMDKPIENAFSEEAV